MINLIFRPEAEVEMLEAKGWYECRSPGLGVEFARAIESALSEAAQNPGLCRRVGSKCRKSLVRRFPYTVVFMIHGDSLVVVACFHQHRDPKILSERVRTEA